MKKYILILLYFITAFKGYSQNQYDFFNINRAKEIEIMADSLNLPATRLIAMYGSKISITYEQDKYYVTNYYKDERMFEKKVYRFIKTEKAKRKMKMLYYKIFNNTETMCKTQYISDSTITEKSIHWLDQYCFFYFAFYKNGVKLCECNQPVIGLKDYEIRGYIPLHNDCFAILVKLIHLY
jgi:hypothetical protein